MQIPELHLLEVVEEWNRRNSYLNFFSSALSGFEAEREFKYTQLLFYMGVNCHGRHGLLSFLHSRQNPQISVKLVLWTPGSTG